MDAINWLLINGANAFWWLWHVLGAAMKAVGGVIDAVLNPILSPVLRILNPICTAVADGIYAALNLLPAWVGLTLISAAGGAVMLVAFGKLSNQTAIVEVKDEMKGHLLALKLFKDDLRVTFLSQFRLLWAIVRLQRYMLVPMLILALPMMIVFAQMAVRYQWRPLRVGEDTLVTVNLTGGDAAPRDVEFSGSPGIEVETPPVPGGGAAVGRIRAVEPGIHALQIKVGGTVLEKELVVDDGFRRVCPIRPGRAWTSQLLYPAEPALPRDAPVRSIEVLYPNRESWFNGADYWVLSFFVVSMAVALALRPVFKVRF